MLKITALFSMELGGAGILFDRTLQRETHRLPQPMSSRYQALLLRLKTVSIKLCFVLSFFAEKPPELLLRPTQPPTGALALGGAALVGPAVGPAVGPLNPADLPASEGLRRISAPSEGCSAGAETGGCEGVRAAASAADAKLRLGSTGDSQGELRGEIDGDRRRILPLAVALPSLSGRLARTSMKGSGHGF